MENKNYQPNHKPRYKKCGIKYDIAYGILTKNPDVCDWRDFMNYGAKLWIWYEGYWYLVKKQIYDKIQEDPNKGFADKCYSQEQFIEYLLNII